MEFDFDNVRAVQFGVGKDNSDEDTFHCVMVDNEIQEALVTMAKDTWVAMGDENNSGEPNRYEPSEKHSSREFLFIPLEDDLAVRLRNLHRAINLDIDQSALDDVNEMFCYFAKFTDEEGRTLTALRRAIQFKGVLKSRLITFGTDALKIIEDKVFKLDNDFDLLIDNEYVYIYRPSSFEFAGRLKEAILEAVGGNIESLQSDLPFVDFDIIEEYASSRPRAARYLASIRSQQEIARIDRQNLIETCTATGVEIQETYNGIVVDEKSIMGFLEVLDRRRYEVNLVRDAPEQYRAPSRTRLR
ncbi:MAG: Kiwa anti-phage protein KwaB-like domain-containing protein [Balneolaceae bacterium]